MSNTGCVAVNASSPVAPPETESPPSLSCGHILAATSDWDAGAGKGGNMPFVFAEDEGEWLEGNPAPPRADQFRYITPPKFDGAPEPVHFSLDPITPEPEPRPPVEPPPAFRYGVPAPAPPQRRSIRDILLGWRRPAAPPQPMTGVYATLVPQRLGRDPAQRRQQFFAIAIPELLNAGVRRGVLPVRRRP